MASVFIPFFYWKSEKTMLIAVTKDLHFLFKFLEYGSQVTNMAIFWNWFVSRYHICIAAVKTGHFFLNQAFPNNCTIGIFRWLVFLSVLFHFLFFLINLILRPPLWHLLFLERVNSWWNQSSSFYEQVRPIHVTTASFDRLNFGIGLKTNLVVIVALAVSLDNNTA